MNYWKVGYISSSHLKCNGGLVIAICCLENKLNCCSSGREIASWC